MDTFFAVLAALCVFSVIRRLSSAIAKVAVEMLLERSDYWRGRIARSMRDEERLRRELSGGKPK